MQDAVRLAYLYSNGQAMVEEIGVHRDLTPAQCAILY
jgi:hypothetical protein